MSRYEFAFDPVARLLLPVIGIRPGNSNVTFDATQLTVRYGPWSLSTPLTNIANVCVTGPYLWIKAIGPRGSMVDHGATFGTNHRRGACIRFYRPVGALLGPKRFLHPGLTVTIAKPDRFAAELGALLNPGP